MRIKNDVRPATNGLRLWLGVLALSFVSIGQAQTLTSAQADSAFFKFMMTSSGAGSQTVGYSSTGQPLLNPSAATLSTNGGANLAAARTGQINNPSGNPITITGTGSAPVSKFAATIGKAAKLLPYLGTGIAIYELMKELSYTPTGTGDALSLTKKELVPTCGAGTEPYGSQCITWMKNCISPVTYGTSSQILEGCPAGWTYQIYPADYQSSLPYYIIRDATGYKLAQRTGYLSNAPTTEVQKPKTLQEFQDEIATKSGWPATSNIAKAVAQALPLTGDQVMPDAVTATGPATSTGTTETVTNPDGSKVTKTTNYSHTYTGPVVNTTTNTTQNTYNTSNVITSTTTTNSTPAAPADKTTECEKYPTMIGCSNYGDKPDLDKMSKSDIPFQVITEVFSSSSGCPSDLSFNVIGRSYAISYLPLCDRLALLRTLFICMAGVMAAYILADSFKIQ